MENLNKKMVSFVVATAILSSSVAYVSADENEMKSDREMSKKEKVMKMKGVDSRKMDAMKEAFSELSESQIEEIKSLKAELETEVKELYLEYKDLEKTEEVKAELMEELKELHDEYSDEILDIVGDNEKARDFLIKKNEQFLEKSPKMKVKAVKNDRKNVNSERVNKYRKAFSKKLESRLEKISDDKLEKVLTRIDAAIEKIDSNDRMSDERKETMLSQLIALKEIVEARLGVEEEDDEIDLDELFEDN